MKLEVIWNGNLCYTGIISVIHFSLDFFFLILLFQINTKLWVLVDSVLKLVNKIFVILSSGDSLARDAVKKLDTGIRWGDLRGGRGPSALGQVMNGLGRKRVEEQGQKDSCDLAMSLGYHHQHRVLGQVAGEPNGPCCSLPLHNNRSGNWGLTLSW